MSDTPIADLALLSDCHGAAIVDRGGVVQWWCPSRFDAPSVFACLLDDDAGHARLAPTGAADVTRRYRPGSLVLETTFATATGTLVVTDALAMGDGVRGHELGKDSPHVLLRRARCVDGEVDVAVEVAPRFEYGLTTPIVTAVPGGVWARGGPDALRVSCSAPLAADGPTVGATPRLTAGSSVHLALAHASSWGTPPAAWGAEEIDARIADTEEAWRSWERDHQRYEGAYADLVMHSGKVLQGLTYAPTGAIVAAATTSLPEVVGGGRNWDYRYSWVRDASLTLDALWVAACPDEAGTFIDYLTTAASSFQRREQLQIMFGIRGERDLSERTLPHLRGWRGSRPVRIGNGAWDQRQIDVYGELLAAVHRLRDQIGDPDPHVRALLTALADRAAQVWDEPDHGIWELRGEPAQHLHSMLMCWVALDRAIALADRIGAGARVDGWQQTRDRIRATIEQRGWNADVGAFTGVLGGRELDAAVLTIPLVGFLPADDPRVRATIEVVADALTDDRGLVYRYRRDDGLDGDEGTFLLCTFWLAEALARAGEPERAREVFERAVSHRNDVALLAEEVDAATGELIGNFPQAFSHVGLVNAAWAITQAERPRRTTDEGRSHRAGASGTVASPGATEAG